MGLLTDTVFNIANTFVFWAAWIIIPIVMEIVPSLRSLWVLIKRHVKKRTLPTPTIWPEITLIIPVYNSQDTLENCLASVDASTYPNDRIRIFCVDNKSSDDSFGAFSQSQKDFGGLIMQWMSAEQGKSRALNMAIFNSTSKYVINVDSDGVLEKHALENMIKLFESDETISCVTGAILVQPDLIEAYPHGISRLFRKLEFVEYGQAYLAGRNAASETNSVYTLSGAFSAFRCSAIRKSWMYNTETLAEDTHVTFQMRYMQGEHVRECEDALFLVDPIEDVDKLYTQRQRWQRGSLEVAKMFGGDRLKARKLFSDISVKTLMYDHTFAFPRVIWYLALFCLLFLGYSGYMVLGAMGVIFLLYIIMGYFYFFTSLGFLKDFPDIKRYYRRQWWAVALLPFFNFVVFFIRLAGIINAIDSTSAWKTRTLTEEREDFFGVMRGDTGRAHAICAKVREVFSRPGKDRMPTPRRVPRVRAVLGCALALVAYAAVAVGFMYVVYQAGNYPDGSDTMFYIYRGDFLYHQIVEHGNWYPLIDPMWYNGVQTFRYWSPLSSAMLASTQALMGGDEFMGYLLFLGILYYLHAIAWLYLGFKFKRPWMGFFIGLIWFFVPNNLFMLFGEGVVARSITMFALPLLIAWIYDYLETERWGDLLRIALCFAFIVMCHVGWAGMVAIALVLFLLLYAIFNRNQRHGRIRHVIAAVALGFLLCGIWVVPSLIGGITSMNSASIMQGYFQPLAQTLNPFYGAAEGYWNRWTYVPSKMSPYFGLVAFVIAVLGTLFSNRRLSPGFLTAAIICLLTSTTAYAFLVLLPGSSYLWMLRFVSIALSFLFVSFLFWRSLRIPWQALLSALVACEVGAASVMVTTPIVPRSPEDRFEITRQDALIAAGQDITVQRLSMVEPFSVLGNGVFVSAGFGKDAKPTSYGQGVQSAAVFRNIVQINEASEKGLYYYMFDRLLELGNDTVLFPVVKVEDTTHYDAVALDEAATACGYSLVASRNGFDLYHYDGVTSTFGLKSSYSVLGIGEDVGPLAMMYPAVRESSENNLNAYSFEELSAYDEIFLTDFVYTDKAAAEDLIRRVSESGTRVVIMANGIPLEEETQSRTFMGLDCETINFENGYPMLHTVIGDLYTDLFPVEYMDWKTVYVNGLSEVWGTIENEGRTLDFIGTGENENIAVIGLGLTFYESLTQDKDVEELLTYAFEIDPTLVPERVPVPIEYEYEPRTLTVSSPEDGVDTAIAYHDIFSSEQSIWEESDLLYVDAGTTVITMSYPYFWQSLAVSCAGVALSILFFSVSFALSRKRMRGKHGMDAKDGVAAAHAQPASDECAAVEDVAEEHVASAVFEEGKTGANEKNISGMPE